jgi:hypothetical protein
MTHGPRHRHAAVAHIAVAASTGLSAPAALAANWESLPNVSAAVTVESLGPSALLERADGAWVLYAPTLSVDCSPPRGCYARTQRIHYDFSCSPRYAVMTERISMDIGGAIVKHELLERTAAFAPSYDAGATSVLDAFCPLAPRE